MKKITSIIILLVFGCGRDVQEVSTSNKIESVIQLTDKQRSLMDIQTGFITKKELSETIYVNGKVAVAPNKTISINNAFGGIIESILVLPGEHFHKGQLLVKMVNNQFIEIQEAYLETREKLKVAQIDLARQQTLNQQKASSDKILQQAKLEVESLRIAEKSLEEKLLLIGIAPQKLTAQSITRSVEIRAPFDGSVGEVFVNKGKYVNPNDVILEIRDNQDKLVKFTVFEKNILNVSIGMKVGIFSANDQQLKTTAEIISVGSEVLSDGTIEVHARLQGTMNSAFLVGMFVKGAIYLEHQAKMVVPSDAVVEFEERKFVFVETKNGYYTMHEIAIDIEQNNWVALKKGDEFTNKKLVVKGAYALLTALKNESEE